MHRTTCPYCNAASDHAATADRVACPRCGESFPPRAWVEIEGGAVPPAEPAPAKKGFPVTLAVLTCLAAAVGLLVFAKRTSDPVPEPVPPAPKAAVTVPPLAVTAFAKLPPGNVAFAVQPAALSAYAARKNQDVGKLLQDAGVPGKLLAAVSEAGLAWDQIDVLAGTVTLANDNILPGFSAALVLRKPPADEAKFLAAFKAEKKPRAGKPTYAATAGLPLNLQKFDDLTWLFGLSDDTFAAAEKGTAGLTPSVRDVLQSKVSPAGVAWAATADQNWADLPAVKGFLPKDKLPAFAAGRQAAAGISLEPDPRLKVAVKLADAAAAEKLRAWFREQFPAGTVAGEGDWAEVEMPFDPAALKKLSPQ